MSSSDNARHCKCEHSLTAPEGRTDKKVGPCRQSGTSRVMLDACGGSRLRAPEKNSCRSDIRMNKTQCWTLRTLTEPCIEVNATGHCVTHRKMAIGPGWHGGHNHDARYKQPSEGYYLQEVPGRQLQGLHNVNCFAPWQLSGNFQRRMHNDVLTKQAGRGSNKNGLASWTRPLPWTSQWVPDQDFQEATSWQG